MSKRTQDADPPCPNCHGPLVVTISRDLMKDVGMAELYCERCGFRDASYVNQRSDGSYDVLDGHPSVQAKELAAPPPANLAQPPADNL